jgi:hypothetical protein
MYELAPGLPFSLVSLGDNDQSSRVEEGLASGVLIIYLA